MGSSISNRVREGLLYTTVISSAVALAATRDPKLSELVRVRDKRVVLLLIATQLSLFLLNKSRTRWQFTPLYVLFLISSTTGLRMQNSSFMGCGWWAGMIAVGFLSTAALLLNFLLPAPDLPALTGPYAVGTASFHWVDDARSNWEHEPRLSRQLMVQIWYPSQKEDVGDAPRLPLWPDTEFFIAQTVDRPWQRKLALLFASHVPLIKAHSYSHLHARLVPRGKGPERFPVLLYSHGYTGFRTVARCAAEELASWGYIVVAVDHTYDATTSVHPGADGVPKPYGFRASLPAGLSQGESYCYRRKHVQIRAADLHFVLDCLQEINQGINLDGDDKGVDEKKRISYIASGKGLWDHGRMVEEMEAKSLYRQLKGRIDINNVGVFGHSFGGGTAIELSTRDPRIKACAGLDAWMYSLSHSLFNNQFRHQLAADKDAPENGEWTGRLPSTKKTLSKASGLDVPLLLLEAPKFFTETVSYQKYNREQAAVLLAGTADNLNKLQPHAARQARQRNGDGDDNGGGDGTCAEEKQDQLRKRKPQSSSSSSSSLSSKRTNDKNDNDEVGAYHVLVGDSTHQEYVDLGFFAPFILRKLGVINLAPTVAQDIVRGYLLAFFTKYLQHNDRQDDEKEEAVKMIWKDLLHQTQPEQWPFVRLTHITSSD